MVTEVIAVVIASVSAGVAVWAKIDSGSANRIARDAVGKAERANEISLASNTISREGNDIAVAANELAEHANAAARASGALQTECNDVVWEASWERCGILQLANVGQEQALNVRAVVNVENEERIQTADAVGDPLKLSCEVIAHERQAEVDEESRRRHQVGSIPALYRGPLIDAGIYVFFRVTWNSELDRPCSKEGRQWFSSNDVLATRLPGVRRHPVSTREPAGTAM